ncbi:hypothetical protein T440DRAFT_403490 [Plenodomus tracheiphilus IPT5]|uniref:Uncharacterized protein n=1 Tax=Plenodomus tracheiphilus IPT5 TaxID=1408161 RepID=A0A6A7AW16_9PLEO|nr:hypothetical protein T440DRAFT_403490 [Plenodomus tracheiphilus IPT5]
MPTSTTQATVLASNSRLEGPRKWLQRQLCKTASRQTLKNTEEKAEGQNQLPLKRPCTAHSKPAETNTSTPPPLVPIIPINIERASPSVSAQAPSRPPRLEAGDVRDINAWLEASALTPSPPLMGGLSYWRTATSPGLKDTSQVQHAVPIVQNPGRSRASTAHSHQNRPIRRCARKINVQMPSVLRTKSRRHAVQKQTRPSASMPVLAFPYETTVQGAPPTLMYGPDSVRGPLVRPSTAHTTPAIYHEPSEHKHSRFGTPTSTLGGPERSLNRQVHVRLPWTLRGADSTRPSTAAADHSREDSMGDLSDAPTYFSGPPPPSYRSRAASILTTSSFGCIDGMDPAQRQKSQERAALRRGMRGKLKRLAHNFTVQ